MIVVFAGSSDNPLTHALLCQIFSSPDAVVCKTAGENCTYWTTGASGRGASAKLKVAACPADMEPVGLAPVR